MYFIILDRRKWPLVFPVLKCPFHSSHIILETQGLKFIFKKLTFFSAGSQLFFSAFLAYLRTVIINLPLLLFTEFNFMINFALSLQSNILSVLRKWIVIL